jgi:acetolactate synthase small subunit
MDKQELVWLKIKLEDLLDTHDTLQQTEQTRLKSINVENSTFNTKLTNRIKVLEYFLNQIDEELKFIEENK